MPWARCAARPGSRGRMWKMTSSVPGSARSRPGWATGCAGLLACASRLVPLSEVVSPLGNRGQRQLGLQTIRLTTIVRHTRRPARIRPPVPAHIQQGAAPLGTARAGPATRRADPADPGIPGRRPALRRRRAPPGIDRHGRAPGDDRRLRHRSTHQRAGPATRSPRPESASNPGAGRHLLDRHAAKAAACWARAHPTAMSRSRGLDGT